MEAHEYPASYDRVYRLTCAKRHEWGSMCPTQLKKTWKVETVPTFPGDPNSVTYRGASIDKVWMDEFATMPVSERNKLMMGDFSLDMDRKFTAAINSRAVKTVRSKDSPVTQAADAW
jgi:hypothetical protein